MNEQKIFNFLIAKGFSKAGAYGLMGNLMAESGMNPKNLQNSFQEKLGFTDDSYTCAVDNGSYGNFVHDSAGYGLAQWTYWSRKENLLKFAQKSGASIGSLDMQLEFLYQELKGYTAVFEVLRTARTIREASDIVLTKYEKPANQSESVKKKRAEYGQQICDLLAGDEKEEENTMTENQVRQKLVDIAVGWKGCKESDGSHKKIIDIYNSHKPLARGYKVQYTDAWCATFGSAAAIQAGYTDIIPTECGCGQMIELFQDMNRWVENDAYVPEVGDYVFYDWDDSGKGDNTGWPDHVGIVVSVSGSKIEVIEGNKGDAVGYRTITVNAKNIRGYGCPDYASKASSSGSGSSGVGNSSGSSSSSGSGLCMTPQWVGEVTASSLNVRTWAGVEYPNIKSWPTLAKGNMVDVCDSVKANNGVTWYYIRIDGRIYGFVSSEYIKSTSGGASTPDSPKVGDIVSFTGSTHYTSSYATATGKGCKPGKAKVTAVNPEAAHPYHLVKVSGGGSTVYGWVNAGDISA